MYAISMDLQAYFDTVNYSKLIEVLSRTIIVDRLGYPDMTAHYAKSTCKLLNRVIPNGTLRGVEGEGQIPPLSDVS